MNADLKKTCFQEISFTVLDSDEKVTITKISTDWNINVCDSVKLLEEWLKQNEKTELYREYIVRGINKISQTAMITVIPEDKLFVAEKRVDNFSQTLYSVQKKFTSNETINHVLPVMKVINLELGSLARDIEKVVVPEMRLYVEKKPKPMFSAPTEKKKENVPKDEPKETTPVKKSPTKDAKGSDKKNQDGKSESGKKAEKNSKSKEANKVQTGKNAISSFFGSKPKSEDKSPDEKEVKTKDVTPESSKSKEVSKEIVKPKSSEKPKIIAKVKTPEKPQPVKKEPASAKSKTPSGDSRKRVLSSDENPESSKSDKKPANKKIKKEPKKQVAKKRARILLVSSSESEDEEAAIQSDRETTPEPTKPLTKIQTSPDENKDSVNVNEKRRFKATRKVTRTYEDEDGYTKTVRETEEYSCSEEEKEERKKSPEKKTLKPIGQTVEKKPVATAKTKPATKQGNIMSFFKKK